MVFGGKYWLASSLSMQPAILASYSPPAGRPNMCDASSHAASRAAAARAAARAVNKYKHFLKKKKLEIQENHTLGNRG